MKKKLVLKISISAMLIAIGWLLPLLTGHIKTIGNMLSPMHIPVFIGGLILGPWYGLIIGFIIPITRFFIFGMPAIFPNAIGMSFELAAYGFFAGLFLRIFKNMKNQIASIIISLVISMILGRAVWGVVRYLMALIFDLKFPFSAFLAGAFINAWPGIILHLILIPAITIPLRKLSFVKDLNK